MYSFSLSARLGGSQPVLRLWKQVGGETKTQKIHTSLQRLFNISRTMDFDISVSNNSEKGAKKVLVSTRNQGRKIFWAKRDVDPETFPTRKTNQPMTEASKVRNRGDPTATAKLQGESSFEALLWLVSSDLKDEHGSVWFRGRLSSTKSTSLVLRIYLGLVVMKEYVNSARNIWASKTTVAAFFATLLIGAFFSARWVDTVDLISRLAEELPLHRGVITFDVQASGNLSSSFTQDFQLFFEVKILQQTLLRCSCIFLLVIVKVSGRLSIHDQLSRKDSSKSFRGTGSIFKSSKPSPNEQSNKPYKRLINPTNRTEIPFTCSTVNQTKACPAHRLSNSSTTRDHPKTATCPSYFRWIHEDLRPWKAAGISRERVESGKPKADFRLVIVKGRAYIETYRRSFQTRDVFTQWGILQLLRRYPGQVPDLDLMFNCGDLPEVKARDYLEKDGDKVEAPPLFRYCGDDESLDIVFPDWSFWGWPEIHIKPWVLLQKELEEGNKNIKWVEREPFAFWKGNPSTSSNRMDLLKCNVSKNKDWNARVFAQDWIAASHQGFKQSDLANQCNYRYKIYMEGRAWSVSQKYILACNSMTLMGKTRYHDFFNRALVPIHHYWPVENDHLCKSIKLAVDWGNTHKQQAQSIGTTASSFVQEELKMDYVFDYMFHVLNEYAKLLTYKPTIPPKAIEVCSESMACFAGGLENTYMLESLEKFSIDSSPCSLPPPFDPQNLQSFLKERAESTKRVEDWERKTWEAKNNQKVH
ncbi:uncharacterized protein [Aristolochia californica]|uniref:uncharacterized protein n=1 Tax=Aristolochia californica TaxID=171875 RepID=UPI0035D7F1F2